jgi:L-2-hydroxyglutarate oxidase LhgO
MDFEHVVIGAGVVGLAVAAELAALGPTLILEREAGWGRGISSRSSEVVHAGIYYEPGSLKARLCVEGRRLIEAWAVRGCFAYRRCGKYIVAGDEAEEAALARLLDRGRANGVANLDWADPAQLRAAVPGVRARAALWSADTAIVDSHGLMRHLAARAEAAGAVLACRSAVVALERLPAGWELQVEEGPVPALPGAAPLRLPRRLPAQGPRQAISARRVVIAAGLEADALAALAGLDVEGLGLRQYWNRGEYFAPCPGARPPVETLVYPVPAAGAGGHLGLHLTVDLGGGQRFGPSAAWLDPPESRFETYAQDGRLAPQFAEGVSRWWPGLRAEELQPAGVGLRPRAFRPGEPAPDFQIREHSAGGRPGLLTLTGIESPGLTAAPAIGRFVADLLR